MSEPYLIPDEALDPLFRDKEFPASILSAAPSVAIVMTQGWCPEWIDMISWLQGDYDGAKVFVLVYDRHARFNEIRSFKEKVFQSHTIPYVRYYRGEKLEAESHYVWEKEFRLLLESEKLE